MNYKVMFAVSDSPAGDDTCGGFCGWSKQMARVNRDALDVMDIVRPDEVGDIADLGLTLAEAKLLQARVQQGVAAA